MIRIMISLVLLVTGNAIGQNTKENLVEITAEVINVRNEQGTVNFALYDEEGFMKEILQAKSSEIKEGHATVTFEGVTSGTYAIICFHDENGNQRMDFETNGMPIEDYGVSNNDMGFGPPQFDTSKFDVDNEDLHLKIKF
ncbi:MAG: DUF2141 domain-containing protein [Flavobacteriaceae bacterium]